MQEMLAVYKISYNNTVGIGGGSLLVSTVNGIKIYSFKGRPDMPDKFFVSAMNSLFVRKGTKAYRDIVALISKLT